jgi:integrase
MVAADAAGPPAPPDLPVAEVDRAKAYARAARAAATRRVYDSDWTHFAAWCAARGRTALPAPADTVAVYLGSEADRGLAPPTIGRKLAAIGWRHRAFGHLPPQHGAAGLAILAVMAGIRRAPHPAPVRKAAADADVVRDTLQAITGNSLRDQRDRVVIGLGMLSALRRSELVAVTLADIERRPEGLLIHVRRSKADQEGRGAAIPVPTGRRIRPVALLDTWLDAAGITAGPVFRRISRCGTKVHDSAMAAQAVAHIVQARVAAAGYDPARFGGHSLRAGFLTSAARAGASVFKMKEVSRHQSLDVLAGYVRDALVFSDHAGEEFA